MAPLRSSWRKLEHLEEHLAWATQEKPAPGALLERVLGAEAARRLERRPRSVG
jgi:hypothetical protein